MENSVDRTNYIRSHCNYSIGFDTGHETSIFIGRTVPHFRCETRIFAQIFGQLPKFYVIEVCIMTV